MNILDKLKELLGAHADKLPENMNSLDDLTAKLPENLNSVEELQAKAGEVFEQHADTIQQVTDKIPGEADDKIVDAIKQKIQ